MPDIRFGMVLPFGDASTVAALAYESEQAGWDGFFVGEALWHNDAWVSLTAAAMRTQRIRLGTMLSPLPSMNPRKLASETATLDNLSGGRVILSVGMGATWMGYQGFPDEATDIRTRAELMDEGLDIITKLHAGEPFDYDGKHHHIRLTTVDKQHYPPTPAQRPRTPIWAVGVWPKARSMRRTLRCDGLIPSKMDANGQFSQITPEDVAAMAAYVAQHRTSGGPFDLVVEGNTLGLATQEAATKVQTWAEAGATWWLETPGFIAPDAMLAHIRRGPPRGAHG